MILDIDAPSARIAAAREVPEEDIEYVCLTRDCYDCLEAALGHELLHGVCDRGPYLQELHVRFIAEHKDS